MSTATVSFTTRLRTWLFVAGLTALLLTAGALAGGAFLYAFVALAVLLNLGGFWFSDRIALAANRARPLAELEAPGLYAAVAELSHRAGIPPPRLYLVPSEQPNAFATGRNPARSVVAVTQGLLEGMPPQQTRAVVAHELAHIRNRDVLVSSIAAMIAGAISAIANVLQFSFLFGGPLERGTEATPMAVNPAFASLYIANPLPRAGLAALFSTHPPIRERVRRLRSYDEAFAAQAA
jgi:heat shock protein HtpX